MPGNEPNDALSRATLPDLPSPGQRMTAAVRARVDGNGLLLSADPRLLRLQEQAGGSIGDTLLLPSLLRLARAAFRTGKPVERTALTADDAHEIRAHGRFFPDSTGVRIELVDWEVQPAPTLLTETPLEPLPQRHIPPGEIKWACDVRLRLVMVEADGGWGLAGQDWLGRSLSELFHLLPDENGTFALLSGLAGQADFAGQSARLATGDAAGTILELAARSMYDDAVFTGFIGDADPVGFSGVTLADCAALDGRDDSIDPTAIIPATAVVGASDEASSLLGTMDPRRFSLRVDGALRRPLGRIVANAETIAAQLQGPIRADYARYATDIALAGRHLLDLVDDLADLQAVERDSFTIAQERVDLADVARRAAGLLAMKAQERGMRIDAPHDDEHAIATGEFRRVLQILLNLIGNAIRYGPDNGMIWLRVETDDGMASITVADQGKGISVEDQAKLFTKFERLGRNDGTGSGLGLYISQRLANAMGGTIRVDSAPGQGARFTLQLPLRQVV